MKTASILFAVLVAAGLVSTARGQYAIGDGTALDNNLQVGGGGVNPSNQVDYGLNAGNNVVTGNVTGLNYFSGRSPYRAPGEFSGNLPTNSLFRFQASSLPANNLGQPGSTGGQTVYRSGAGVTAADVLTHNYMLSPRDAGRVNQLTPSTGSNGAAAGDYTAPRQQMGAPVVPDGRRLELNASPLMGVRPGDTYISPAASPDRSRDNPTINGVPVDANSDGQLIAPAPAADPNHPDARAAVDGQPADRQMAFQFSDRPLGADGESLQQQVQGLEARLNIANSADAFNAGRGNDVYMTILQQVDQNRRKTGSEALQNQLAGEQMFSTDKDVPNASPDAIETFRKQMFDRARQGNGLDALNPGDNKVGDQEDPMRDRLNEAWPRFVPPVPGNRPEPGNQQPGEQPQQDKPVEGDQLPPGLSELLNYDLPTISTLASNTRDQVNELLRRAERELLDQRYYDAEDSYRTALELQPGNPMARVGQVHAQLGVGMVYTAGQSMRSLFLQHPELIAARYDPRLLPASARLQWVREELAAMLERDQAAAEPALLMAYLAYQFGEKDALQSSLDEALRRQPDKAIVQLLRRIWLKNQSASVGEPVGSSPSRMLTSQ